MTEGEPSVIGCVVACLVILVGGDGLEPPTSCV